MASLEECTWNESHVVWYLPPSACVHVTHGTWKMESKCEESEKKFPLFGSNQGEKKEFSGGRKGKEKKEEKKRKEMRKRKEKRKKKGRKERKERKNKIEDKKSVRGGKKGKKGNGF